MKGIAVLVLLALSAVAYAGTPCEEYVAACIAAETQVSQNALISLVVDNSITALQNSGLWRFFNGSSGRTAVAAAPLKTKLVAWFAGALGCNATDPSFTDASPAQPVYSGAQLNLTSSHIGLGISARDFVQFVGVIGTVLNNTLQGAGVDPHSAPMQAQYDLVGSALLATQPQMYRRTSICDRYSDTLGVGAMFNPTVEASLVGTYKIDTVGSNWAFWQYFVGELLFPLIISNSTFNNQLLPFFNGSRGANGGAGTNFLTNAVAYQTLLTKLAAYFGAATQCSEVDFVFRRNAAYPSIATSGLPDLSASHHPLNINSVQAGLFINAIASAAGPLLAPADLQGVGSLLVSLNAQIVAPPPSAPPVKPATPTATGTPVRAPSASASGVAVSAFFVVLASLLALLF